MSSAYIFNRRHLRQQRARHAAEFKNHGFLFDWAAEQLLERLQDIARDFKTCIILGSRLPENFAGDLKKLKNIETVFVADIFNGDVIADHETLPFAATSADLIISVLDLHTINDLPGSLTQIRHILKPDGLFLGCILGGETLYELRETFLQTEIEYHGGASLRVAPFADKPQLGNLMQRAGFALPVIDSDILRVSYQTMFNLMGDLRGMGESNMLAARQKHFTPPSFFAHAAEYYQTHFKDAEDAARITASFEVIFLSGWSPHESQQKPLRPGSAERNLAEIL